MNPPPGVARNSGAVIVKVIAWVAWALFVLVSLGWYAFATAAKNDVYFARYYGHHPMNELTVVMILDPWWMTLLPIIWLPLVVVFQRQASPKGIVLIPLLGTMMLTSVAVGVLIFLAGPPIQM